MFTKQPNGRTHCTPHPLPLVTLLCAPGFVFESSRTTPCGPYLSQKPLMAARIMLRVTLTPLLKQWTFSVLGSGFGGSDVVDVGSSVEVGSVDVASVDVGAVDMGTVDIGAVEGRAVEGRAFEGRADERRAVRVGALDVGVTLVVDSEGRNVGSLKPISSAQAWSSSSCSSS